MPVLALLATVSAGLLLVGSAAAGRSGGLCSAVPDVQCPGEQPAGAPTAGSAAECCKICQKSPNCTAWTWNGPSVNHYCYAKPSCNSTVRTVHKGSQMSGSQSAIPLPAPPWAGPSSRLTFESSHAGLANGFAWSKMEALQYVQTNRTPGFMPSYWCDLPAAFPRGFHHSRRSFASVSAQFSDVV